MARTTTTRKNSIIPMKGQPPTCFHTASGGPRSSHAPVTLFAPDGGSLYQVLVSLFSGTLPDLYTLIEGHQQQQQGNGTTGALTPTTRTTDPTQWRDSFTVQDDSNPFGTPETMSVDLCWYRDQFGHAGVNCQLFLTASADFPPLGWACVQAHRRGIAVLVQDNPEMACRHHNEQYTTSQLPRGEA